MSRFVEAGLFWKFVLPRLGGIAITMPWRTVYMLPEWLGHEPTRYHESVHLAQMDRDGTLCFCVRYVFWTIRYGYRQNPYELEANRLEAEKYGSA